MELFDAIFTRRSYRGMYKPEPVPREDLKKILEAVLAAPSGCNKQTTSAIAVDDPAIMKKMAELIAKKPNFASAPACICILTEKKIAYGERTFYIQDYSASIQTMLLAIHALGYASCWIEGNITDADRIGDKMADILGVPEDYELVAVLPVGIPAEEAKRVSKLTFAERAWFNGFGK